MPELHDWQDNGQKTTAIVDQEPERIDIKFGTGAELWIEYQDGRIRVHCYRVEEDEPVNVEIYSNRIEIDTNEGGFRPLVFLEEENA